MDILNAYLAYFRELNMPSMMLRIVLAVLYGGIIGFEREKKNRGAGFRTYMLVALGATLTVMLSQYLDVMLHGPWAQAAERVGVRHDVSRFGAQVINGVGFLGAGTIIVTGRQEIRGLTTAVGLWASACVGLAIGAGFYECVIIGGLLILLCLELLPAVESAINSVSKNFNIHVELDSMENLGSVANYLRNSGHRILDVEIEKAQHDALGSVSSDFILMVAPKCTHAEVLADISAVEGVIYVEEI